MRFFQIRWLFIAICATIFSLAVSDAAQAAAILNNALRNGLNTINDTDALVLVDNDNSGTISPGDQLNEIFFFDNISNSTFTNTALDTAVGVANYRLQGVASFNVVNVIPSVNGPLGSFDILLSGSINITETTVVAQHVDFSTDNYAVAAAKVALGAPVVTLTIVAGPAGLNDFGQSLGSPVSPASFPSFPGTVTDAGLTFTANPGMIPFIADGVSTVYDDRSFNTNGGGFPQASFHDLVARVQTFLPPGGSPTAQGWDLLTDTTVQFIADIRTVPEPGSVAVWGVGIFGLIMTGMIRRRRRS